MESTIRRGLAAAFAACAFAPAAQAVDVSATGSFMFDWLRVDEDRVPSDDVHGFRRARVGVAFEEEGRYKLRLEHDLTERSQPEASLALTLKDGQALRLGQFKQPFTLDDAINERQTPFMEPSLPAALAIGRRIGAEYAKTGDGWTLQVATFGQRLDGRFDGHALATRGTWVPLRSDASLLHLGAGLVVEDPKADEARFNAKPEANLFDRSLVDTGVLRDVSRVDRANLELLWLAGPWSIQSELVRANASRDGAPDFTADGAYLTATWSPTGDARVYKAGNVQTPAIGDDVAWELLARVSTLDLDDGAVRGGEQTDWTLGATLYVNPNVRLMANYVVVDSERRGLADDPRILEFRVQLTF